MYRSLSHLLTTAFTNAEQLLMGYSNTASIMRLAEQEGASGSTSPEDLSMQEQKAQAVWVLQVVADTVKDDREMAVLYCLYAKGSTAYSEGLVELARHFDHVTLDLLMVDKILTNIYKWDSPITQFDHGKGAYKNYPSMVNIAEAREVHVNTVKNHKNKMRHQLKSWQYAAEDRLLSKFIDKGLILQKVA